MHNLAVIEEYYKKYINNLNQNIPEGIFTINLGLLERFNLLNFQQMRHDEHLTRYFQVIESSDKITLINEEFIIWIMTHPLNNHPVTYTLIALNREEYPQLELAFTASGIYNSTNMVLRVLDKFLVDIQENEDLLFKLEQSSE